MLSITEKLLDNKLVRPGIKKADKKYIVIHYTANTGKGANALANRNYWNNISKPALAASAEYVVDDKTILRAIPDDEVAYHVGAKVYTALGNKIIKECKVKTPNFVCIGIEICVNSDGDFYKTIANTKDLVKSLMNKYSIPVENVVRHFDITGKNCPAFYVSDETKWEAFKKDLVEVKAEAKPTPTTIMYTVVAGDTLSKIAAKYYDGDASKYKQIKIDNNLTSDIISIGQVLKIIK